MRSRLLILLLLAPGDEAEPGLVAEYFALDRAPGAMPEIPAGRKPTFVQVEEKIDHALVTGDFHGTKLAENFFARWRGLLRCEKEGLYNFYLESDDGSRLFIDGELVVDNAAGRAMEQKPDRITLARGDHAIRFEYFQRDGPAGVNLQWKPPDGGRTIVPAKAFFHAKGAEKIEWDRLAWEKRPAPPPMQPVVLNKPGRYATIDFGPFLTRTIGPAQKPVALSGVLLRVAPEATVCFDTRALGVAAAWTGSFLTWPTEKDGVAGFPTIAGTPSVQNVLAPRRGRWHGLYLHGSKAILSYATDGVEILELDGFENGAFTRTIRSSGPVTLSHGTEKIPIAQAGTVKVSFPQRDVSPPEDLEALIKGGPARWTEPVETKGVLGRDSGAYQVDTLTVPYENPWKSYMRIVALDFFPDGRAAVATLDGDVWIVSGIDAKLEKLSWKRFATGLYQPLGLRVVDGTIYVLGRDQITRLHDLNGDGEADFYENFNNDCALGPSYGEYAMDLQTDREGNFYYAKAAASRSPHSGCVFRIPKDGSSFEVIATGFRAPMGLCVGPDGWITATDQQGNYMGECPIVRVKKGGFYGFVLGDHPDTKTASREPALCWLPMDMDNSSGGQVWVPDERWGPLRGKLLHTSYGQCRLFLVLMESSAEQAGVVQFPLTFQSGIMRAAFSPADGQLYVAGLRGWQTTAARDGCLQRVRYTGKPLRMPVGWRARKTGIELTFAEPLDRETAADADNYSAAWFNVVSTPDYGSPEFYVTDPKKRGREKVEITKASVLEDRRTVSLEIPGLRPVTNLILRFTIRAADRQRMSHELSLTINRLPE